MTGITASLHLHKRVLVRGTSFLLAGAILCAALVTGSILRDPSRGSADRTMALADVERKDQTRLGLNRQPDRHGPPIEEPSHAVDIPTGAVAASSEWRDEEFAFVEVVDGRTIRAGSVSIRLADLELPHPEQVCRTLDNRLEQCAARAATQLELITRSRRLACRYRMITSSEAVGECRIGANDVASRMIRTGYVQRAANEGGALAVRND
jgi:hypothetical protein